MASDLAEGYPMIAIRNLYHMLAYAFRVLQEREYVQCATETFENAADLLAAILVKGVAIQVRRGLGRDYQNQLEQLSCIRGKVELTQTLATQSLLRQRAVCAFDEFTTDCYLNRILKTAMARLLKCDVALERKKKLRNLLLYFDGVEVLNPLQINWTQRYHRNNQSYRMLVAICYLVLNGLIQSKEAGVIKVLDFDEAHKERLYEKFILEYYRKHFPGLKPAAQHIPWALESDDDTFLPQMKSDITLTKGDRILIIDAKYYAQNLKTFYERQTLISANLYQLYAYVKNKQDAFPDAKVSGMLLYAKTAAQIQPDNQYVFSGNRFTARTLDLNAPFCEIAAQLNTIAEQL